MDNLLRRTDWEQLQERREVRIELHYDRWSNEPLGYLTESASFEKLAALLAPCQALRKLELSVTDQFFSRQKERLLEDLLAGLHLDELRLTNFYPQVTAGQWTLLFQATRARLHRFWLEVQ